MKIDSEGQFTIPSDLREKYGLQPGTEIEITAQPGGIFLTKAVPAETAEKRVRDAQEWIRRVRGCTKGRMSTDEILQMTRGED